MANLLLGLGLGKITGAAQQRLVKGQLYNLDLNQMIGFQFNPTTLEWERAFTWAETIGPGESDGGDVLYLNTKPRTYELQLLFKDEPGAPSVEHRTELPLSSANMRIDFQALRQTLEIWEAPLENKGRPSRVRIIMGPNYFDGVILRSHPKITRFFEDLQVREALWTLEFREWQPRPYL